MASYEVELKFHLPDPPKVGRELTALGAVSIGSVRQTDIYFSHPQRDFATTDEALRIRSAGEDNCVTYKGPILDAQSKTRQEIELTFAAGSDAAEQMWALLRALGFRDVRRVVKARQQFTLTWESRSFEVAMDSIDGLGEFLEIETISTEEDWPQARDAALRLSESLSVGPGERRSYLQLLLDSD